MTLLSAHILENEHLFPRPILLNQSRQIFSIFYTAALRFREDKHDPAQELVRSNLTEGEWIKAVVQGATEKSPRWRHTLMIGGLLLAYAAREMEPLPLSLQQKLEGALVHSSNLALGSRDDPESLVCVIFVLNHTFNLLSDIHRLQLDYNMLLPVLFDTIFFSREGLEQGYWLGIIDQDVRPGPSQKFNWSTRSPSARRVQEIKSRPLVTSLGMMARLLAQSIEHTSDPRLILDTVNRLADFAKILLTSWRQNKLSEVHVLEESQYLDQETISATLPPLLHIFRDTMFATIITLRAVLGRLLCDQFMATDFNAPVLATRCLEILRNLHFISHRFGQTTSSQYMFIYFTPMDILSQYPRQAESFLASIKPQEAGRIPAHPLDRTLDLFFLNSAEHFTLTVPASTNAQLLDAAFPYVQSQGDPRLGELYEAAHSVVLAVFAAPQNSDVIPRHIPLYVEILLQSFPQLLNPRQFRLAIKSVAKLAAPPSTIATVMPMVQAVIMDLLSHRFSQASEAILPPSADVPIEGSKPLSEKSVLHLAMVDSLSCLPVPLLQECLPITADLLHKINDPIQRNICQQRLWEVMSNGDMDVERAAACVCWWNSRGGRELVVYGELPEEDEYTMSGALEQDSKL